MPGPDKRVLYVGGLADDVKREDVHAACIPFGEIAELQFPVDNKTGKHRGFAFVTFIDVQDAAEALFNLDRAEFFGRIVTVTVAKPQTVTENSGRAVWDQNADTFFQGKLLEAEVVDAVEASLQPMDASHRVAD